jgi:hypothetical protein
MKGITKEVLIGIITTIVIASGVGVKMITVAWADARYMTILAFNNYSTAIQEELREDRKAKLQWQIDTLEYIRDNERDLTPREIWELKQLKSKVNSMK